jgi:hypothetical protein
LKKEDGNISIFESRPTEKMLKKEEYKKNLLEIKLILIPYLISAFFVYRSIKNNVLMFNIFESVNVIFFIFVTIALIGSICGLIESDKLAKQLFNQENLDIFSSKLNEEWYKNNIKNILPIVDTETYKNIEINISNCTFSQLNIKRYLESGTSNSENGNLAKKKRIVYAELINQGIEKLYFSRVLLKNSEGKYIEKELYVYFEITDKQEEKIILSKTSIKGKDFGETMEYGKMLCTEEFYRQKIFNKQC